VSANCRFDIFCVAVFEFFNYVLKFHAFGLGLGAIALSTPRVKVVDLENVCQSHNFVFKSPESHRQGDKTNQTNHT
jgi:hypothetical protein